MLFLCYHVVLSDLVRKRRCSQFVRDARLYGTKVAVGFRDRSQDSPSDDWKTVTVNPAINGTYLE